MKESQHTPITAPPELVGPDYNLYRYRDDMYKVVHFKSTAPRLGLHKQKEETGFRHDDKLPQALSRARRVCLELALCNEWKYFATFTIAKDNFDRKNLQNEGIIDEEGNIDILAIDGVAYAYGVTQDLIEKVRGWLFAEEIVVVDTVSAPVDFSCSNLNVITSNIMREGFGYLMASSSSATWALLEGLGVNDRVLVAGVEESSPYYLIGYYFDENGIFRIGRFYNYLGVPNSSLLGVHFLSDLQLFDFGTVSVTDSTYSYFWNIFYNISEFFINIIFGLVSGMLELLPDIQWSVDTTSFQYFLDIVKVVGYLLPVDTVSAVVGLIIDLTVIRILISIPKAIWDLLPLV